MVSHYFVTYLGSSVTSSGFTYVTEFSLRVDWAQLEQRDIWASLALWPFPPQGGYTRLPPRVVVVL